VSAQTPEQIVESYQVEAEKACLRVQQTLQVQGATILRDSLAKGDTDAAELITHQLEMRLANLPVESPYPALQRLFAQHEQARRQALKPVQENHLRLLEALVGRFKTSDIELLARYTEARRSIESDAPSTLSLSTARHLQKFKIPRRWGYFTSLDYGVRYGTLTLEDDGHFVLHAAAACEGSWRPTGNPWVLEIHIEKPAELKELTFLKIEGREATMRRKPGERYLRAD
jgi:hypothetical protein